MTGVKLLFQVGSSPFFFQIGWQRNNQGIIARIWTVTFLTTFISWKGCDRSPKGLFIRVGKELRIGRAIIDPVDE
jgi:hypothetical protein